MTPQKNALDAAINDFKKGCHALAIELPASVYNDFSTRAQKLIEAALQAAQVQPWKPTSDLFDESGKMTGPVKEYILWDAKTKRPCIGTTIKIFGNLPRFTHFIDMNVFGQPEVKENASK